VYSNVEMRRNTVVIIDTLCAFCRSSVYNLVTDNAAQTEHEYCIPSTVDKLNAYSRTCYVPGVTGPVVMDYKGDRIMDYQVWYLSSNSDKFDGYMRIPLTKAGRNTTVCAEQLVKQQTRNGYLCMKIYVCFPVLLNQTTAGLFQTTIKETQKNV